MRGKGFEAYQIYFFIIYFDMIDTIFFGYGKPATSALSSNFSATGLHAEMPNYPANGDIAAANKAGWAGLYCRCAENSECGCGACE